MRLGIVSEIEIGSNLVDQVCSHVKYCKLEPKLNQRAYQYASIPICIIDSVFSIGVKYQGVIATVDRFCNHVDWKISGDRPSATSKGERTISDFLDIYSKSKLPADELFSNNQRTSPTNGILKSVACNNFACALFAAGINDFCDQTEERLLFAEASILSQPGQGSGLSFDYFRMLAGNNNLVKPDRMVQRFVANATKISDEKMSARLAGLLLRLAANKLGKTNPAWTALSLDHSVWQHQREAKKGVTP